MPRARPPSRCSTSTNRCSGDRAAGPARRLHRRRGVGGAEICLGNLVAELPQSRYAITVLATDEAVGASVAARRPDVSLETVPPVRDKKDLPPIVAHLRALRRLRPQLVHLNLRTPYSCQYGLLAALTTPGVRTVAVEHLPLASQDGVSRWIKRRTSTRLAAHVAVGVRAARLIEAEVGLPPGSIRTIPNGVPLVDLPAAPRLAAGPVIGSLGRFDEQKATTSSSARCRTFRASRPSSSATAATGAQSSNSRRGRASPTGCAWSAGRTSRAPTSQGSTSSSCRRATRGCRSSCSRRCSPACRSSRATSVASRRPWWTARPASSSSLTIRPRSHRRSAGCSRT